MEEDRERLITQVEKEHGASEFIDEGSGEHHHPPEVNPWVAIVLLIVIIGLLSITAEWVCEPVFFRSAQADAFFKLVKSIDIVREKRIFTSEVNLHYPRCESGLMQI
jgi:hypothetical protein